jgi:hypothetical protein
MKTITIEGINYPVLKANKNGKVTCPFCRKEHTHGKSGGDGHRVANCTELLIINPVFAGGSQWCFKQNGYFVEFSYI